MKKISLRRVLPYAMGAVMAVAAMPALAVSPVAVDTPLVASVEAAETVKAWDFKDDIGDWCYAGGYAYSNDAEVDHDSAFGGSLKLTVDYSLDNTEQWSEVKLTDMGISKTTPIKAGAGISNMTFDMYYDPAQLGGGTFMAKIFAVSVKDAQVVDMPVTIPLERAKDVPGSKYKKVTVKALFDAPVTDDIAHLELSIVGSTTGYQGDIFFNNMQMK